MLSKKSIQSLVDQTWCTRNPDVAKLSHTIKVNAGLITQFCLFIYSLEALYDLP